MNGNSSIERRYSFNIAQTSPVAESTHLGSSFSWGNSISMRPRSNSSLCLNNVSTSAKLKHFTKIDARIAADVQSKGLASRIVKYHETGTRLNRSVSAHNLYSKPGQFPAVTLKKTELPYRATKQDLSMIRIPPPEKSSFYGNRISSLLKSNSIVGLQSKRTEENRPIIHPPPTDNDMAPTRSVLDVLKEISRKRINSDDLQIDEASKKYCSRGVSEFVDAGTCTASTNSEANIVTSPSQNFKRHRDCTNSHQCADMSEAKTSPEQVKKRVCNYNNDITSSLSSSVKSRFNEKKRSSYNLSHTISPNLETYDIQKPKIQCFRDNQNNKSQTDMRFENLANNLGKVENVIPITPIPTTPCIPDGGKSEVVCQTTASEPVKSINDKTPANEVPRLTLFNKKYEVEVENDFKKSFMDNTDELNNFDEYAGIPFVKPKRISTSCLKNPVIERTQKSKLALMLSGLRGELYNKLDKDDVDSTKENQEKLDKKANIAEDISVSASKSVSTVTTTLTNVTSSCNSSPNTEISAKISTTSLLTNSISSVVQTSTSNKTSSPLVGLKLSQVKSSSTCVIPNSANDKKIIDTDSKINVPMLGGFSFNTTNTSVSASMSTTVTSKSLINQASTVSESINVVNISQPTLSNVSIGLNFHTEKDSNTLSFPTVSTNPTNFKSNTSLSNISLNTANSLKPSNTFVFGANVAPTTTNVSEAVKSGSLLFTNSTTKSNSSFSFSVPSQSLAASSIPINFGSLTTPTTTTSTILSTAILPQATTSGLSLGAVTTSNVTYKNPMPSTFSLTQSKTSAPIAATTVVSADNSLTSTLGLSSQAPITSVSTFGTTNNTGLINRTSDSLFSFGSQPKTQNSDEKNNSNGTHEGKNLFNSNSSSLFGASGLIGLKSSPIFGSSTNNSEKNIFCTTNTAQTPSVFGSKSINSNSKIFGSNTENKSSPFSENNTNSSPAPFSFGSKPSTTAQAPNNSHTAGGFSFGSSISSSTDKGTVGFGNIKQTATSGSSNNVFGTVSTTAIENKTFAFGATSNKNENTAALSGGFSFSSVAGQKPSTFSFGTAGNSTSGFSFGGTSSPVPAEISNKPFSFGTQQTQAQQCPMPVSNNNTAATNIFTSLAASTTSPSPVFNFNSGSSTPLQQQSGQSTNNIFASTASNITTGPGDRPIRRATRRLQK